MGVSESGKTAFRYGHNDQEASTKFMTLGKRRHVSPRAAGSAIPRVRRRGANEGEKRL